jgi:cytochrome oxidase Cu insertion factor (SCO1/SenC/PrrC family)
MNSTNRSRKQLVAIALIFAAPLLIAFALSLTGWRPRAERNNGELIEPPVAFMEVVANSADGVPVQWNTAEGIWHVLVLPPRDCAEPCVAFADTLRRVRIGLNQASARVAVLYVAAPDDRGAAGALAVFPKMRQVTLSGAAAPTAPASGEQPAVYLVDPHGYLVLRYAPGFDPVGLRADLKRLLK